MTRSSARAALSILVDRFLDGLLAGLSSWAEGRSSGRLIEKGARIGRLWVRLRLPRTGRVREQLEAAYPEASKTQIDVWTLGVFEHFGRSLAELILLRGRHREALLESVELDGLEHLAAAEKLSPRGGVLIVTAHYGNWELAGVRVAALGMPISAVFRGLSQPALDRTLLAIRSADGFAPVDYEQIRMGRAGVALSRALKAGRKVLVLLDQNARRDEGVFVPFFGRPACVRTGPLQLAIRSGVPILPAFIRRDAKGAAHRIRIHPPLLAPAEPGTGPQAGADGTEDPPGSVESLAARLTALIEAEIREDPRQWIWTHRRWRTQPQRAEPAAPAG